MAIKAGHCTGCNNLVWRVAVAQKDWGDTKAGETYILWPLPESLYAVLQDGDDNQMVGIAYCPACAPSVGTDGPFPDHPVLRYERALERYENWYTPGREKFYRAWLQDQLFLEPAMIETLMTQWEQDRHGTR